MSTLVDSLTTGLELIERQAFLVLFRDLNDAIVEQEAAWTVLDAEFETETGQDVSTTLEQIEPDNFHQGHRPSLIQAPIEQYPNCCVIVDRQAPVPNQLDQSSVARVRLAVEIMCKSEKDEGEVTRRVKRTADAVQAVLMKNSTLDGVVQEIYETPSIFFTDLFPRDAKTSYGKEWFWQGARIERGVQKETAIQSSSEGGFFSPGLGSIDQG